MHIRLATYNVHRCIGYDKKRDPKRINAVLEQIRPDIVAFQEVVYAGTVDELDFITKDPTLSIVVGPTITAGPSNYGNVLVSRYPPVAVRKINLSYPGREKRGAVDVDIDCHGTIIRVIATHLGLAPAERRSQAGILLERIEQPDVRRDITILMGDMNEWFLWGRPLRWIHEYFGRSPSIATYPARFPLFSLDKIWCHPSALLNRVDKHDTRLARSASDHLPLTGCLDLGEERSAVKG